MNETKRKGFLKLAVIMLIIMMLALCVVAGTLAKYTSTGSGTISVEVATWDIEAGGTQLKDTLTLGDFHIYDTVNTEGMVADDQVTTGKIAPGTWGYYAIKVENKGDVDAIVSAKIDGTPTLPMGMTVKVLSLETDPEKFEDFSFSSASWSDVTLNKNGGSNVDTTVYVVFEWVFENGTTNDEDNTKYGTSESALESLGTLTITATQVD